MPRHHNINGNIVPFTAEEEENGMLEKQLMLNKKLMKFL